MRRQHASRRLAILVLAAGMVMIGVGILRLTQDLPSAERYDSLASSMDEEGRGPDAGAVDSTDDVHTTHLPDPAVAWVRVDGTPIDLPVASGDRGFSWYLHHDLWDRETELGCPFLDPRCPSADNRHALAYGHHISFSSQMFSSLHRCHEQAIFDELGDCLWTTPTGRTRLAPLCAISVDQDYGDVLRFSFPDDDAFRVWACELVRASSAKCAGAEERAASARRIVTLVTCSSELAGRRWRTLVLFAC